MRIQFFVGIAICASVAIARDAPATQAEKEAAARALTHCLADQAMKLDDDTSDVTAIAAAIAPACGEQGMSYSRTMASGQNDAVRQAILLDSPRTTREIAANIVLKMRAFRREERARQQP